MTPELQRCFPVLAFVVRDLYGPDEKNQFYPKEKNHMLKKFLKDETGAELAEYAVGVALLVAIGVVVYKVLGNAVNTSNSTTGGKVTGATYP